MNQEQLRHIKTQHSLEADITNLEHLQNTKGSKKKTPLFKYFIGKCKETGISSHN